MIYLNKGEINSIYLNINNNSRDTFTGYTLTFLHSMSQDSETYTIDISDPTQYTGNTRYCILTVDLSVDDLRYYGQYELKIFGNGSTLLLNSLVSVEDGWENFDEYQSDNENNENYIYTT